MYRKNIWIIGVLLIMCVANISMTGCKEPSASIEIDDENLDVSQTYFYSNEVAKGENGYYFFGDHGKYVLYYDEISNETIPLCSKVECTHSGADCSAYVKDSQIDYKLYYYGGKLYWLTIDGAMVKLLECKADGTSRRLVGEMYAYNDEANEVGLMFANGFMYFTENGVALTDSERIIKLRRMNLKDGTTECVYEYKGINAVIQDLKVYSNKLYFTIKAAERTGENIFKLVGKGLFLYDVKTGQTEHVLSEDVSSYCVDTKYKALYYYVNNKGLYRSKDGNVELVHSATKQTGMCMLAFDGEYVYMDNNTWKSYSKHFMGLDYDITSTIWIYDDGKLKSTIDIKSEKIVSIYNGDSNYFFALRSGRTDEVKMRGCSLFSKKDFFETGKINWIEGDVK